MEGLPACGSLGHAGGQGQSLSWIGLIHTPLWLGGLLPLDGMHLFAAFLREKIEEELKTI